MGGEGLLTVEEGEAIHTTWSLVTKDLKGNGVQFFLHFFTEYPQYQRLFRDFANVPFEKLAENQRLKAHAFTVMTSINGLVENINEPEVLKALLLKIGQNHGRRSLKTSDFLNLNKSLLNFFEKALGDAWTPVAHQAWAKVLSVMGNIISEGIEESKVSFWQWFASWWW